MHRSFFIQLASVLMILVIYESTKLLIHVSFLPDITGIAQELWKIIINGKFITNTLITLIRIFITLFLSFILASFIGILMGLNKRFESFFSIPLLFGITIPGFIWAILSIIWVGLGENSVYVAATCAITPYLALLIADGIKNLDPLFMELANVYNLPRKKRFLNIILPQMLPLFISVFRNGFFLAWKLVAVSEVFGLGSGVGYQINLAYHLYNSEKIFAWLVSFILIIILIDRTFFQSIENKLLYWKRF